MKIDFSKLKGVKLDFKPKKREFKNLSAKAAHDWRMLLVLFAILILAVAGSHIYFFLKVNNGEAFGGTGPTNGTRASINKAELESTINVYEEKKATLEFLKTNGKASIDPSF